MPVSLMPVGTLTATLSATGSLHAVMSGMPKLSGHLDFTEQNVLVNTVFTYKGSVIDISGLPANADNGDAYYVESDTTYYAWMGERWQDIGAGTMTEDLTAAQIAELQGLVE